MNILLVSYDYRPNLGGVATCAFNVATTLNLDNDIDLTVLAQKYPNDSTIHDEAVKVKLPKVALFATPYLMYHIWRLVKAKDIDVVINMLWLPSGIASFLLKISLIPNLKYFVFAHGVEILDSSATLRKRIRKILNPLRSMVFKNSSGVLCVSNYTAKKLKSISSVSPNKVHTIYNGVDQKYFLKKDNKPSLFKKYYNTNDFVFLSITRLVPNKGIDKAIKSFAHVCKKSPNLKYLIGGTGSDKQRLQSLIGKHELQENVFLCGKIEEKDIVDFYNSGNVHILLSREDKNIPAVEGFGLVFLEAAACGLPSIAGRSGGTSDAVIHNETGILVKPTNIKEIAHAIEKFATDKDFYTMTAERAYQRVQSELNWTTVCKKIKSILEDH